jgi:curved DNA-binding protein CbpA
MALLERNHYRVLAVAPDATTDEIERSFRQLARRAHPDLNGGDGAAEERMKELNVARQTLTDPATRAAYDERLRREQRAKEATPPPRASGASPTTASATTPTRASAAAPTRASADPPESPVGARKPLSKHWWTRPRDVPRAPGTPSFEIDPWASVGRVLWIGLLSLIGLAVVVGLIFLHEGLDP